MVFPAAACAVRHSADLESAGRAAPAPHNEKNQMKFLGKFKPYLIPIALGIVGALVYDRWVKSRLPMSITGQV